MLVSDLCICVCGVWGGVTMYVYIHESLYFSLKPWERQKNLMFVSFCHLVRYFLLYNFLKYSFSEIKVLALDSLRSNTLRFT